MNQRTVNEVVTKSLLRFVTVPPMPRPMHIVVRP